MWSISSTSTSMMEEICLCPVSSLSTRTARSLLAADQHAQGERRLPPPRCSSESQGTIEHGREHNYAGFGKG
jgi:hypothetical protein